ncbi:MAG: 4-(cytidine 5'-diphospho)-2-C-methyl-D-erythritol kinase [Sulfitobacter sp.]
MISEAFAPAKINLSLHVTGQRADGYHLLDSLVVFADVGDRLWFEPGKVLSLDVTGPFSQGVPTDARNLVWQAAVAADWSGRIRLEKNLPNGAGIGGGSSDAATMLRYLDRADLAAALGADVPVCVAASAQRMQGIGDVLTPIDGFPKLWAVLVNPGVSVATPDVFKGLAKKQNSGMPTALPKFHSSRELMLWLAEMRNDLETPAIAAQPIIGDVLRALSGLSDVGLCRMSGSGGTCFVLCDSKGQAASAAHDLRKTHPDWWIVDCALS